VLFDPSIKVLGLLDSKLSWEHHLRSLIILKVISGWSWDGDRMVMLRLYLSLVSSELDYGSFVHGSATKPKLATINHMHNTGIEIF
jgi:hypothetical protein